jgi:uncharacterized membrane protein (Fun14 family)
MTSDKDLQQSDTVHGTGPWRFRLIVVLLGVVTAAAVMRAARGEPAPQEAAAGQRTATEGTPGMTTGVMPGEPRGGQPGQGPAAEPPAEKGTLDTVLPFVTEGGVAMILGLLLGMVTRSILKVLFVLLLLGFVGIQYLVYKQILTVDWGAFKDFILNMVPPGANLATIVQQKLPSLGAFGLGYLLGLKRG